MPAAAVVDLHGDPEQPTPGLWDGALLERLDDAAIDRVLRVARPGGPLMIVELRHIGGGLAVAPAGAGARGALEGRFASFALGLPRVTGSPDEIHGALGELAAAFEPVATGTRFANFSGRAGSLRGHVPDDALARLAAVRAQADPDGLLVAPYLP
jgi:hypothetical protein